MGVNWIYFAYEGNRFVFYETWEIVCKRERLVCSQTALCSVQSVTHLADSL